MKSATKNRRMGWESWAKQCSPQARVAFGRSRLLEVFDADHPRRGLDTRQRADARERRADLPVRRFMNHQNQRNGRPDIFTLRLEDRRDADVFIAQDACNLRDYAGA